MGATTQKNQNKMLLHICCAGCGAYVSKVLKQGYKVTLYFSNPNIFPEAEYEKRKKEVEMISKKYDLPLVLDVYNHKDWLSYVKGLENEAEKGKRCFVCYKYRLKRLAQKAKEMEIEYISTTLSVSPYKEYQYIKQIGENMAERFGIRFHNEDFKKRDGFKKSMSLSKELGLYRQRYCGCEFSIRD